MNIHEMAARAREFAPRLKVVKDGTRHLTWYPYGSLNNFIPLQQLLEGKPHDILALASGRPVADIGAADGDVGFFLESLGLDVDLVDHGPTNINRLEGARVVKSALGSRVGIHDLDLDGGAELPRDYGLVFFLGILYHLQNPFAVLKMLARRSRYAFLSTRIARGTRGGGVKFDDVPVAYLLGARECNNDPTNYWIFSDAGLRRLLERTGWRVLESGRFGAPDSDPSSTDKDERAVLLIESRVQRGAPADVEADDFQPGETLAFSVGQAGGRYLASGWSVQDEGGVWSDAPASSLVLPMRQRGRSAELEMWAIGDVGDGKREQKVEVEANGAPLASWTFREFRRTEHLRVAMSAEILDRAPDLTLRFRYSDSRSRPEMGNPGGDDRHLAFHLNALRLTVV